MIFSCGDGKLSTMQFNCPVNIFMKRAFLAHENSFRASFIKKCLETPLLDNFSYRNQDGHHVTAVSYCFIQNIQNLHPHLLQSHNEGTTCRVHLRILLHILLICFYRLLMNAICLICSENNKWIIISTENRNGISEFEDEV